MYSELDELQEADWVRKQKIKQSKAAAERLQAEAEDEVHLEREFSNMKVHCVLLFCTVCICLTKPTAKSTFAIHASE